MDFIDVVQNMALGIAGGIYSSIIVSVAFYLLGELQKELELSKKMVSPLYGVLNMARIIDRPNSQKIDCIDTAQGYFETAFIEFATYDPGNFKYEIRDAMNSINEILESGEYGLQEWNKEILLEVAGKIEPQLRLLEQCEVHFGNQSGPVRPGPQLSLPMSNRCWTCLRYAVNGQKMR